MVGSESSGWGGLGRGLGFKRALHRPTTAIDPRRQQLPPNRHILGCQCALDGRSLTHPVGMIRPSRILLSHVDAHSITPPVEDKQIRINDRVPVAYDPCFASHAFLNQGVCHGEMFEPFLFDWLV